MFHIISCCLLYRFMKNMAMQIVSGNGSWDGFNGSTLVCQRNGHRHSPDCDMASILDVVGYNEDLY